MPKSGSLLVACAPDATSVHAQFDRLVEADAETGSVAACFIDARTGSIDARWAMRSRGPRNPDIAVRVLDPKVSAATVNGYLDTLTHVVPAITDFFNPTTATRIRLVVDPGYTDGPAATGGGVITVSAAYARAHPRDLDIVTHEVTHIVQGYSSDTYAHWWHWVEGVADYARYRFGRDNAACGWSIADHEGGSTCTDGYRATARFLAWTVDAGGDGVVQDLDAALRNGTYSDVFWTARTGDDIAALWSTYVRASAEGWKPA